MDNKYAIHAGMFALMTQIKLWQDHGKNEGDKNYFARLIMEKTQRLNELNNLLKGSQQHEISYQLQTCKT